MRKLKMTVHILYKKDDGGTMTMKKDRSRKLKAYTPFVPRFQNVRPLLSLSHHIAVAFIASFGQVVVLFLKEKRCLRDS